MKPFPKGSTLIKIFAFVLTVVMIIAISVRVVYETENKQLIALKKSNFESYFDFDASLVLTNETAKIKYSIEPKRYYSKEYESSYAIDVVISVSFYKKASTRGNPIETEKIYIELRKTDDYKKSGNTTIKVPQNA